jgi:predicted HTH domain antitoxin
VSIKLEIPDSIARAMNLPEERIPRELLVELAVALYTQDILSFGKARELAQMGKYEFSKLLGERGIARHYGHEELEEDLRHGRRK